MSAIKYPLSVGVYPLSGATLLFMVLAADAQILFVGTEAEANAYKEKLDAQAPREWAT